MFDSGIAWLQQEIKSLRGDRLRKQSLLKTVEEVVDLADPMIRLARGYRKTLLPSIETSISYCRKMIASIPGPVRLHRNSYYNDLLVKAFFRSVEELELTVQKARKAAAQGGEQELFGLLTMTTIETTTYGHKQQGELILGDVPMQAVTFVDHRIVAPTADLQSTMIQLEQRSLEILANVAMEEIASLKANLAELRARRERLGSMNRILRGKRQTFEIFAQPEQDHAEKIRELQTLLRETEHEIELAKKGFETPDDTLDHLKRILDFPNESLVVRPQSLRLNWMNVLVPENEAGECQEIHLAELSLNQELLRSAILVCFDR